MLDSSVLSDGGWGVLSPQRAKFTFLGGDIRVISVFSFLSGILLTAVLLSALSNRKSGKGERVYAARRGG